MSLDQTPTETKILSKPTLEAGSNGCVFWPPPPTQEENKLEGDKNYLVKFVMYDVPDEQQLRRLKKPETKKLYIRFAKQTQKEVRVGATIRDIDPTARYLAGIWEPYPTLDTHDPLVNKRCKKIDTFHYFPENFRAFILPFRGTPMEDTLNDYIDAKKPLNWATTLGPLFLDMAKGLNLMHENGLVHLDIHDGNYLISTSVPQKGEKSGNFQGVLIDFDRVISKGDPDFDKKLQDVANEQIDSLRGWYNREKYLGTYEWNLSRLPPEVVRFPNVQRYDFEGRGPEILVPQQWHVLTNYLIDASVLGIEHAEEIEQYWKRSYQGYKTFNNKEQRENVDKMDIFALGRLYLAWMCQCRFLLKGLSQKNENKFFAFVVTRMLNPNPLKRPSAQIVVDFLQLLVDLSLNL